MKIGLEHLGTYVSFNGSEPMLVEGFEREFDNIYFYTPDRGAWSHGSRPAFPQHPNKAYWCVSRSGVYDPCFEIVDLGFDYRRFGEHEKLVRDLVDYLDKRYLKSDK